MVYSGWRERGLQKNEWPRREAMLSLQGDQLLEAGKGQGAGSPL